MRALVRNSRLFFVLLTTAGLALRLFFVLKFANWDGDPLFYGDLAKNWLQHGILGTTHAGGIQPCLIRLPGYPAFLAAIWAVTGVEHYRAVLLVHVLVDIVGCFVTADLVWRTLGSERTAKFAFALAALCPFTANYTACALTETLAIFLTVGALDLAVLALESEKASHWAACGGVVGGSILLRPDGGILLPVIGTYGILRCLFSASSNRPVKLQVDRWSRSVLRVAVFSAVALSPLVPWTLRNWRDFHTFQPLVPRYANDPGQFVPAGFQRWVKSWIVDYASVAEIYWRLGEDKIDLTKAPARAFDSPQERLAVSGLFAQYNARRNHDWTPELDTALNRIASARIARHPCRYYLLLPGARIVDMWFRPRTEMLGIDDRWWELADAHDSTIAIALGGLNLLYVAAAAAGTVWLVGRAFPAAKRRAGLRHWELWLALLLARSLFLGSLENPEPRYTLECYPVVIALAAIALSAIPLSRRNKTEAASVEPGRFSALPHRNTCPSGKPV